MANFQATIQYSATDRNDAQKTETVLQNIAANTDSETIDFLHKKIIQNPLFFKNIAKKLQNPMLQKMLK